MPDGSGGHFTSGGSEANFTGMLCALQAGAPAYGDDGLCAFARPPCIFVSEESHLAWLKIAHAAGVGRNAVRLIQTDGSGRMDPEALTETIETDVRSGNMPVMIAATAGTTNAGMVDPLTRCGEIARKHGMWFHVDAAWGGALIARDTGALKGIEQADSITIDAHKWFATTMGAGMFLTSRPDLAAQGLPHRCELHAQERHGQGLLCQFQPVVATFRRTADVSCTRNSGMDGIRGPCRARHSIGGQTRMAVAARRVGRS